MEEAKLEKEFVELRKNSINGVNIKLVSRNNLFNWNVDFADTGPHKGYRYTVNFRFLNYPSR